MIFTVEEINRDAILLPGVSLGYRVYNGCGRVSGDINLILSSLSVPQVRLLCLLFFFFFLKVSHLSTCACLSDRRLYPTFFRTVPSDRYQISGLAQLMKYFDWRWVGVIYSVGMYSEEGTADFVKEAKKEGICIEYSLPYSQTSKKLFSVILDTLLESSSNVVLLFMSLSYAKSFLSEIETYKITGKQWIGTESWIMQPDLASADRKHILHGAMGFALPQASIPGLGEFLFGLKPSDDPQSAIIKAFWEEFFDCSYSPSNTSTICTGAEDLRTVSNDYTDVAYFREENNVYKAVYSVAYALHSLLQCQNGSNPTTGKPCVNKNEVLEHIKYVNFTTKNGVRVLFDEYGQSVALYDLVNWQMKEDGSAEVSIIGQYDASFPKEERFRLKEDVIIVWGGNSILPNQVPRSVCREPCPPGTRKAINKNKPVCCFDCFKCPEGTISNQTTLMISVIFLTHKETPIVRANNSELSFLLLFSLKLCFLCSLTFIGRPSEWSCMLRHTAFGITFVLCISCVLGKTLVVLMAFRATLPSSNVMKWFGPVQQRLTVLIFTLIQVMICIVWLTITPPFPNMNLNYYKEKIILECALGSAVGFWAVLGYIGLLAILCFILAFLARKLPDSFNEAKLITFSMLIFCAVWITFIPAYVSSPGKFTVAVEIFAILASSFGLLVCIFVPKCYIIIFRPEQNSKKHLMGKIPPRTI
uniref:G-protein coupled receptors family 3 profile domain-containing protein n=1 Tax=Oreochromis aureus TaxID=47969 RepID=A0AAZ1Y0L4_OREAU